MVINVYNPNYLGGGGRRIERLRLVQAKLARPYLKNKIQKNGGHYLSSKSACRRHSSSGFNKFQEK
jgi:hypothetical protein